MIKVSYISNNENSDINYLNNFKLEELLKGLNFIELNNEEEALRVASFLKGHDHFDIFIMSKSLKILNEIYKIYDEVRLVYEVNDFISVEELRKKVMQNNLFTICLPYDILTQELMKNIKLNGIKVLTKVNTDIELYKAVLAGVDGVISNDLNRAKIEADLVMMPLLVSHRGFHEKFVENSVEAGLEGYNHGADFLEMDVHLTKDLKVVVNHDETLGRTYNKDFKIKNENYDKLKTAKMRKGDLVYNSYLPLLSEFDQNIPADFNFLIEVKTETKFEAIKIGEEINNLKRNFQVMTFYPWTLIPLASVIKNNSNGFLIDYKDKGEVFNKILRIVNKYRVTVNPYYENDNIHYREQFFKRMVEYAPWGIKLDFLNKAIKEGFDKLNSDYIHLLGELPKRLVTNNDLTFEFNDNNKELVLSDDKGKLLTYQVCYPFGNELGLVIKDNKITSVSKKGEMYLYLTHKFNFLNEEIKVASDLIRVSIN